MEKGVVVLKGKKKSSANARAGVSVYFLQIKNSQIVAEIWMPKGPKAVFTESIL